MTVPEQGGNESLGMRIGGGLGSNEGDTPIYIANINPQGPVGKSKQVKVRSTTTLYSQLGEGHGLAGAGWCCVYRPLETVFTFQSVLVTEYLRVKSTLPAGYSSLGPLMVVCSLVYYTLLSAIFL